MFRLTRSWFMKIFLTVASFSMTMGVCTAALAQQLNTEHLSQLRYRFIGPDGNRAIAVAGIPGDPSVSYIGAASGGLWKTTDKNGRTVLSGNLNQNVRLVIFENQFKDADNQPDFELFLTKKEPKEDQGTQNNQGTGSQGGGFDG